MCRYGLKQYKPHFVCFSCKKGFKKTRIDEYMSQRGLDEVYRQLNRTSPAKRKSVEANLGFSLEALTNQYQDDVGKCPDCGEQMARMGLDFRVPSRTDLEQWDIVEVLYEHGFAFRGCGCDVGYSPPSRKSELSEWLKIHSRKTKAEKLLQLFESRA